jgi:transcriptional antiterminator
MNENIILTIIEFGASILVEGVILSMLFSWIDNRSQEKQEQHITNELNNIEKQNKFDFEQLQAEIRTSKQDILNQIKESAENSRKDANPK